MTIHENVESFDGKPVIDFDSTSGIKDVRDTVYRLRVDYEANEAFEKAVAPKTAGVKQGGFLQKLFGKQEPATTIAAVPSGRSFDSAFQKLFVSFLADPAASAVTALVIGDWGGTGMGNNSAPVVAELVKARQKLTSLRSLFVGDMVSEESEISWITQSDLSPLWPAYPDLVTLRIRGGNELSLGNMSLASLKTLIIETGGLPGKVLGEVMSARLPLLEHLELWLGDKGYGWDADVSQLQPILEGKLFPKLKYLGLRNSEVADELAVALATAPVLAMIETLDLSMGNLSDKGAAALFASRAVSKLKKLDIHHHYLTTDMMKSIKSLPCEVDVSEQKEADLDGDEVYRYVAVSE